MSMTMRGAALRSSPFGLATPVGRTTTVMVVAQKKVVKRTKVILMKDMESLGKVGDIKQVPVGYWRNFLLPTGSAKVADAKILEVIRAKKENQLRAAMEVKAQAQALATALTTFGKFSLKKKVGEKDTIYGSVSKSDVCEAIYQQTGQRLEDKEFTIPDMKTLGSYECTVTLHPEVSADFLVVVVRDKTLNMTVNTDEKSTGKSAGKKKK
eukprot:gene24685-10315_t